MGSGAGRRRARAQGGLQERRQGGHNSVDADRQEGLLNGNEESGPGKGLGNGAAARNILNHLAPNGPSIPRAPSGPPSAPPPGASTADAPEGSGQAGQQQQPPQQAQNNGDNEFFYGGTIEPPATAKNCLSVGATAGLYPNTDMGAPLDLVVVVTVPAVQAPPPPDPSMSVLGAQGTTSSTNSTATISAGNDLIVTDGDGAASQGSSSPGQPSSGGGGEGTESPGQGEGPAAGEEAAGAWEEGAVSDGAPPGGPSQGRQPPPPGSTRKTRAVEQVEVLRVVLRVLQGGFARHDILVARPMRLLMVSKPCMRVCMLACLCGADAAQPGWS